METHFDATITGICSEPLVWNNVKQQVRPIILQNDAPNDGRRVVSKVKQQSSK